MPRTQAHVRPLPGAHRLIDLIYAALLQEAKWQDFLDELRRVLPNGKSMLFFHDVSRQAGAFPLNSGLDPACQQRYDQFYSSINPWMKGASIRPVGRVVRAETMLTRERLHQTEFYNDWMRPEHLESGIGVTIKRESHCNFLMSVLCAEADDARFIRAMSTMQALVPHIRRVFEWYDHDERGACNILKENGLGETLHLGIIKLGLDHRVRGFNSTAERMLECASSFSIDHLGRFRCLVPEISTCIDDVLASWMRERCSLPARTFLVPKSDDAPTARLTVVAPPGEQEDQYFRGPECVLIIEEAVLDTDAAAHEFASLHRLTIAETRVIAGLAAGHKLDEIAKRAGTSLETTRRQLRDIFSKTGIGRQTELVRQILLFAGRR